MILADRTILAPNLSLAWADALTHLLDHRPHEVVNLVLRIENPLVEDPAIRAIADELLVKLRLQEVNEVANTIFPAEWAADLSDPAALAADYREHYEFLQSLGSAQGTYFGRIVAYPDAKEKDPIDQLTMNVAKLKADGKRRRVYKSVYEFNIYSAARDRKKKRGFPCLAHVGMHIGPDERLNATAQYRYHDVVAKGYGNYLGLGGLLGYVANAADWEPGELLVVAGGAFFDAGVSELRAVRALLDPLREASR
jgi:thymidylate synthase